MNKKGTVTEISENKARVSFPDIDNIVSGWLPINRYKVHCAGTCNCGGCYSEPNISIGSNVLVCFYDNDLNSGIIMAELG